MPFGTETIHRSATHLALLRGINVGGKNKLPMKDLSTLFVESGCASVRTYIQSGNVVFEAAPAVARRVADDVSSLIAERFGYRIPVVSRTRDELLGVVRDNPYLAAGQSEDALHVMFLADRPTSAQIEALDPDRSPPDSFRVLGREVYLHLPAGVADSKLTNAYFDAKLATISTGRNRRTVLKPLEMMVD